MEELLFYDIEIFKNDSLVIFKDINKNIVRYFHNDFKDLEEFLKDKVLVGYNNYNYDDKILAKMVNNWTPYQLKQLNDRIISGEKIEKIILKNKTLDCYQQIDVSFPSLKYIEGNMGKMILESSIDFNLDRKLTEEEFKEVFEYCSYDIDTTIDIYKMRENNYFKTKEMLVNKLGNNNAYKWNTTTISANLLIDKPLVKWSGLRGVDSFINIVPEEVVKMWNSKEDKSININKFDNEIIFGSGGLHGAPDRAIRVDNVISLDVASMYPHIIININALGIYTKKYKEILERRIAIKHVDKNESDALKLILNSVYGLLNNKYSPLYNPNAAKSVCVYGQIALYDLCKRLSKTCKIYNINTDGVIFKPMNEDYKRVWKEWENDYNLTLEEDKFDLLVQKDVNNYIAVQNGKVKAKGGYVNRYNSDMFFKNNSARIVDIAIVEHLINDRDVLDVIFDNIDKPHLFQYILKAGNTFKGTFDKEGNQYQKINRVFAARNGDFCLYKKREDGGLVKFADSPDKMYLWNDDCDKINDFRKIVDINFYYNLIMKKLEDWRV